MVKPLLKLHRSANPNKINAISVTEVIICVLLDTLLFLFNCIKLIIVCYHLFIYSLNSFYARLTQIFLHWARTDGSFENFPISVNFPLLGVDRWAVPPAPPRQAVVTKGQGQQLVFVMQPT